MNHADLPAEWTDPEYLANMAADELRDALNRHGIGFLNCGADGEGNVHINFKALADASTMLTLAIDANGQGAGSLCDRASSSCIALADLSAKSGDAATDEQIDAVIDAGWTWMIHPAMFGRRVDWHVSVTMPMPDAMTITSELNTVARGGAL